MRDRDDSAAAKLSRAQRRLQQRVGLDIDGGRGLVQHQDVSWREQSARQRDELPLSLGEVGACSPRQLGGHTRLFGREGVARVTRRCRGHACELRYLTAACIHWLGGMDGNRDGRNGVITYLLRGSLLRGRQSWWRHGPSVAHGLSYRQQVSRTIHTPLLCNLCDTASADKKRASRRPTGRAGSKKTGNHKM